MDNSYFKYAALMVVGLTLESLVWFPPSCFSRVVDGQTLCKDVVLPVKDDGKYGYLSGGKQPPPIVLSFASPSVASAANGSFFQI